AILTAVLTTVISFIPVFAMQAAEGKLFKPLAFTKTFALIASIMLTLTVLPLVLHIVYGRTNAGRRNGILPSLPLVRRMPHQWKEKIPLLLNGLIVLAVGLLLTGNWYPLGAQNPFFLNLLFVGACIGGLMLLFRFIIRLYPRILARFLDHKAHFLVPVSALPLFGLVVWLGFRTVFFFIPTGAYSFPPLTAVSHAFPGLGREFMPSLDEGSYLYMPTTMTHASIGEVRDILRKQDMAIAAIPEVESAVGKLGRAESPLDPAPVSMIETIITVKSEYITDENGKRLRFQYDRANREFMRDQEGDLIPDPRGRPFRQWRDHIHGADDIWDEIVTKAQVPGVTAAPRLQPIAARLVMLQSGMRAPMGIKVRGPDLQTIEQFGMKLEQLLKKVPSVKASAVFADRIVGKPYLEIVIDRDAIARYGVSIQAVQTVIEVALGGKAQTVTVEGRERYAVRVRYPRELRGLGRGFDDIKRILVATSGGARVPLGQMAAIGYRRGPQVIKSENTFPTGYVLFDKMKGNAEVDVVQNARHYLQTKIDSGELVVPDGVSYVFAGTYENQVRSEKRLAVILPLALFLIFLILYLQFRKVPTALLVFAGILVAWSGGFILIWLYGQDWFMNLPFIGEELRRLFQIHPINLSVAIWVGFLALFGIASDNGVVICTFLDQRFASEKPASLQEIRKTAIAAASRRVRPALMTSATTILALLPILTSTGRGADVMVPMAIPSFGGMVLQIITIFLTPVLYCWIQERKIRAR
ncbi:MAG: AcrB/AcrD/AcrF family protein, partial [Chitinivibrionales bacterium]|nr:AcrB/AcrD/AcrF family protein [Chitinivibrionales bacterium]